MPTKDELKVLPVGVMDEILLSVRKLSVESVYKVEDKCPECSKKYESTIDTDDLERREGEKTFSIELKRGIPYEGKVIKKLNVKYPNGFVQELIFKHSGENIDEGFTKFGDLNTDIIHKCLSGANGAVSITRDMVSNMARIDRKKITDAIAEGAPGPQTSIEVRCASCGNTWNHQLNPFDFLL
jgi:hypothetical protein